MKLWLLKLKEPRRPAPSGSNVAWVIRAEDEAEARWKADHESTGYYDEERNGQENYLGPTGHVWLDSNYSTAEELTADGDEGVILVDRINY